MHYTINTIHTLTLSTLNNTVQQLTDLPREVLFDYLKGRWNKEDVQKYIQFSTTVRDVVYNKATDDFTVSVKDLKRDVVKDGER